MTKKRIACLLCLIVSYAQLLNELNDEVKIGAGRRFESEQANVYTAQQLDSSFIVNYEDYGLLLNKSMNSC